MVKVATGTEVLAPLRQSTPRCAEPRARRTGNPAMKDAETPRPPVVIGLLGGIASGKSTVSGILAESGFRVLELSTGIAGPYAGRLLASLGASRARRVIA